MDHKVVTLVASRSGLEALCKMHPDVQVHLASIDELSEVRNPALASKAV